MANLFLTGRCGVDHVFWTCSSRASTCSTLASRLVLAGELPSVSWVAGLILPEARRRCQVFSGDGVVGPSGWQMAQCGRSILAIAAIGADERFAGYLGDGT